MSFPLADAVVVSLLSLLSLLGFPVMVMTLSYLFALTKIIVLYTLKKNPVLLNRKNASFRFFSVFAACCCVTP